jgi:hypothetical protein
LIVTGIITPFLVFCQTNLPALSIQNTRGICTLNINNHTGILIPRIWAHSTGRGERPLYKLPIEKRPSPDAFFLPADGQKKPGFPLQVLGFANANPVGFPLQSLAPHSG